VIIVKVGASGRSRFVDGLREKGIEVLTYEFRGDHYSLPNVLPLLALPTRAELVETITARDLPRRPVAA
jgi:hypothetical protein